MHYRTKLWKKTNNNDASINQINNTAELDLMNLQKNYLN